MEWDDIGKGEEDEFLADWKSQVRRCGYDDGSHRDVCVDSPLVSLLSADVRCAAALARQHGSIQQLRSGVFLLSCTLSLCVRHPFTSNLSTACVHISRLSSPSTIHPLCLQAVSDIADQVSARSRTAFSVRIQGHRVHLHSNQHEPSTHNPNLHLHSCACLIRAAASGRWRA